LALGPGYQKLFPHFSEARTDTLNRAVVAANDNELRISTGGTEMLKPRETIEKSFSSFQENSGKRFTVEGCGTEAPRRVVQCLFQRAIDRVKHVVQVAAEAVDGSKDRDRNACRDQTIFDRGGTGPVGQEFQKSILQAKPPGVVGSNPAKLRIAHLRLSK
jgi:hypothetical protein